MVLVVFNLLFSQIHQKKRVKCVALFIGRFGLEGDTVLCGVRSCNSSEGNGDMVDIIHKYRDDEVNLDAEGYMKKSKEELEDNVNSNIIFEGENDEENDNDDDIDDFLKDI